MGRDGEWGMVDGGQGGGDTINYKTLIPKERMPKDSVKNHFLKDQNSQEILQITKIFQKRN